MLIGYLDQFNLQTDLIYHISGKTIMITIDLLFSAESFNFGFNSWMSTVPAPPANTTNDFRFKVLNSEDA